MYLHYSVTIKSVLKSISILMCSMGMLAESVPAPFNASALEDVVLKTSTYQDYKLGRAVHLRKVALLVFPGAWDPYSIHALKILRNMEPSLADLDVQIIGVTMDSPLKVQKLLEAHDIPFVIASDPENIVARLLGTIEIIDEKQKEKLRHAGVDFTSGDTSHDIALPVLQLSFFLEDGSLRGLWTASSEEALISSDKVKELATQLNVPPVN